MPFQVTGGKTMRTFLIIAVAYLLSACAGSEDKNTIAGYSCPPSGLSVTGNSGAEFHFKGAEPGTGYCHTESARNGRTTDSRYLFYFFPAGSPSEGSLRTVMRSFYPLKVGNAVTFVRTGGGYSDSRNGCYRNEVSVIGEDTLEIGDERREAWLVNWVRTGCSLSADLLIRKLWIDKEYNIILRNEPSAPNSSFAQIPYYVTSIRRGG